MTRGPRRIAALEGKVHGPIIAVTAPTAGAATTICAAVKPDGDSRGAFEAPGEAISDARCAVGSAAGLAAGAVARTPAVAGTAELEPEWRAAVAESLSYTPSAVSQQLTALEREAGVPLLERTGRRVVLTAAGAILVEHAEAVLAADARDPAFKAMVDEKMLIVFEACSFQDITGQRVAKVIETLKHIEARVARFNDALRVRDAGGFVSEAERASAERKERLLLNGPQPDATDRQSEVDRLMAK